MMKKNEVLEILKNGGHIGMDTIRCRARVYDVDGIGVGTCRYDTADRIGHTDGYSISQSSGWNFYKRVRKDVIEAPEQETTKGEPEQAQEAAQNEEENNMTFMDDFACNYVAACMAAQDETEQTEQQPAETEQEKTDRENREHCKRIADELEAYVDGSVYRCPECGETFREDDAPSDDDDMCTCPCCNERVSIHDLEQCSLYDYLADALDIDYTINGSDRDTVQSVRVMVAFGGPTIYIDSATRAVELYWWTDRASYPISSDAADALDEWAQELWSCC